MTKSFVCNIIDYNNVAISVSQNRQESNKKPGFGLHLIVRCLLQIFMDRITFLDHKTPKGNT